MNAMSKKPNKDKANDGAAKASAKAASIKTITLNKRVRHEYHLEDRFEAGMALQGDSYAIITAGEMFLVGAQITPLISASTHVVAEERRTRKLLLHRREIDILMGRVQRDGYTVVLTALYWKGNKVKAELALAKGKQSHDKRDASKERDWDREKQRTLRHHNKNA
jgi:SsrA-binding protein